MSRAHAFSQSPGAEGQTGIRTVRHLHHHFFELTLKKLQEQWRPSSDVATPGIGFFAIDRDAFGTMEANITHLLEERGWETLQVNAWCWNTRNPLTVILCGWLDRKDFDEHVRERVPGVRGWIPQPMLLGSEGAQIFFEHLGIAFSELLTVDLFDHLPHRSMYKHSLSRHGGEDWVFDYSARTVNLAGLCYTRCRWGIDEQKGLVLEREPGTCREGHHNALLQAAAPMMYETLRELAKDSPSAHPLVLAALSTLEDPEWEAEIQEELISGTPGFAEEAVRLACGHGTTRMIWRTFMRDYLVDEAAPEGVMEPGACRWLLSGYVDGTYVTGEALILDPSRVQVRVLHPYRGLSMTFEPAFHPASRSEALDHSGRLAAESILAGLFLLSRWIGRNWSVLQRCHERFQARLAALRIPPFHETGTLATWRKHMESRLEAGKISPTRFIQETEWARAENFAHDAKLKELQEAFFDTLPYPDHPAPIVAPDGSLTEPSPWSMPRLTEDLQSQILACLVKGEPPHGA